MLKQKTEERVVFKSFEYAEFEAFQIFMEYLRARLFSSGKKNEYRTQEGKLECIYQITEN